jgi:hypothetical protein
VIIHPLGTPATEVEVPVTVDKVVATHGQPVRVEVLLPRPAGMEGEAEVAAGTSAVATELAAPPEFQLILPPTA